MKKRLGGGAVAALILLLGAAFSVYTACFWKPPVRPLVILSERVIYEFKNGGPDKEWRSWAPSFLSPDGRYLILIGDDETNSGPSRGPWYLVDVRTRELTRLPFPPECRPYSLGSNPFTSDGKYIHVIEPDSSHSEESGRPWVLLYDIANRTLRTIKVGPAKSVVSDDNAENLWVSTRNENVSISIASGAVAKLSIEGIIFAPFGKDRLIVKTRDDSDLAIVDLGSSGSPQKLHGHGDVILDFFPPFHTADGRFLCYNDRAGGTNYLVRVHNQAARILPFIGVSQGVESWEGDCACFWDTAGNRSVKLLEVIARAAGPTASSVWITPESINGRAHEWRLLDLATGAQYSLGDYEGVDFWFASGSHLVYWVRDNHGGVKIMMIEVALPEPAR